ncbi:MAG: thioredoxin family protein [Saprospiraceae bacterium]|nr:thioredoxin family protein [Saprospiraceae bacterium]
MRFTIILLFILSCFQIQAQKGINFFHGTWEEALAEAKAKDKLIFVDAYAVWCGPCKRMAKNVFTDKKVGEFYNENFINMKIDMEKKMGRSFGRTYPVSAFPTLMYIDYNGELVHKVKGGQQIDPFIKLGKFALGKVDFSKDFKVAYEKGDRSPELVYNYVKALNKAGKSTLKISNEYVRSQNDLTTDQNLKFLLEAATHADSRIFDLMIENKSAIEKLTSKQDVKNKIEKACFKSAKKAVKYQNADLHKDALKKMKKYVPEKAAQFAVYAEMEFCLACGDGKKYLKACEKYAKKEAKNNPEKLNDLALAIFQNFPEDTGALKKAEKYAKKATEKGTEYNYFLTYATILLENGKKQDALIMANKSLDLAKGKRSAEGNVMRLIRKIERS